MNRRAFVKSGLLFVPALLLPGKLVAHNALARALLAAQYPPPAGGGGNGLLNGLVSVWEMEAATGDNQPDATASAKDLTEHGTPNQSSTHIQGSFSTATGGSVYYTSADAAFKTTGSFSLAIWYSPNGNSPDGTFLASRWSDTTGKAWVFTCASGQFSILVRDAADSSNFSAASTVNVGTTGWHLIVMTYTAGDKKARISVDGETFVATATTDGLNSVTSAFALACFSDGTVSAQTGLYDETAYWDGVVLTQTQVTTLYNSGSGFFYSGGLWTN